MNKNSYFGMIDFLCNNYSNRIVVSESFFIYSYNSLCELYDKLIRQGYEINLILLYCDLNVSNQRLCKRQNRESNSLDFTKNVKDRLVNMFEKFESSNKYKILKLDTSTISEKEVFNNVYSFIQ